VDEDILAMLELLDRAARRTTPTPRPRAQQPPNMLSADTVGGGLWRRPNRAMAFDDSDEVGGDEPESEAQPNANP